MASSKHLCLNTVSVDDIAVGDLIELSRLSGLYAHWVVYVGNGEVIHLSTPPSNSEIPDLSAIVMATDKVFSGSNETKARVRRDRLSVVSKGSAVVVNNECDEESKPFPGKEIVKRAESKLGTNDYNLATWNCEHFATWCRYGKAVSKQFKRMKKLSRHVHLVKLDGAELIPRGSLLENFLWMQ